MSNTKAADQLQRDIAHYIAAMSFELRELAETAKLYSVMVPLEFAYYEASSAELVNHVPSLEAERINRLSETVKQLIAEPSTDGRSWRWQNAGKRLNLA